MDLGEREVRGVRVPGLLYGTAWKEERTRGLVEQAIAAGFRGIDTANQRKHYHEAAVGEALRALFERGTVRREELFLQTKFTHRAGQDHRLPYDPRAPVAEQVAQSFERSLEHLGVQTIDSLVLHGPSARSGLAGQDWEAWQAMEVIHAGGRARLLGVSNVSAAQLDELAGLARVRPAFVQNRCYAELRWDAAVREVAARHGVLYQGFSLLTANRRVLEGGAIARIAARHGRTPAQIVLRFAVELGMLPLTGTTDARHMQEDLAIFGFALEPAERDVIARAAG